MGRLSFAALGTWPCSRWFAAAAAGVRLGLAAGLAAASLQVGAGEGNPDALAELHPQVVQTQTNSAWNWHVQGTAIVQGDPGFPADYSGPRSLHAGGEVRETLSLDVLFGLRLWRGAEMHVDGLVWQGFGLSQTAGIEGFPNGEAFRLGNQVPNVTFARAFLRQTAGWGEEEEVIRDDALHLQSTVQVSRVTLTVGKFSAKDIFDNNRYANDARTQFLSWALMANEGWDYPADSLGFTTGLAVELNQPRWTWRFGFFQMPRTANGMAQDSHYLEAWGMVTELERRFEIRNHPGAVRMLAYLNRADMGSLEDAVEQPERPANIETSRRYRLKAGFGLNLEQELAANLGAFARLGWNDGQTENWVFADVDRTASLGLSLKGARWRRPLDVFGLAGFINGISRAHQDFFAAGGLGILAGDGRLNYGWEKGLETYYDFQLWRQLRGALDYQFVVDPAYNQDRGPVSIFAARLHWEF